MAREYQTKAVNKVIYRPTFIEDMQQQKDNIFLTIAPPETFCLVNTVLKKNITTFENK